MRRSFLLIALSVAAVGCRRHDEEEHRGIFWGDRPSIALMPEFQAVAAGAKSADSVVILEGLPHPLFEQSDFAAELATKETITLGPGYAFYARPIAVRPEDLDGLRARCTDASNFRMPVGVPLCGGFHADYAVRWKQGDRTFDYVFCFGCAQAEMYLGKSMVLDVDMLSSAFAPLLAKYRAQRPGDRPFR